LTVAPQIAVKIESAQDALANVLANAGCSLHRDAVDARLIDEVKSFGTRGKISHNETEAGGTGELKEVHAPANLKALDAE
jgi:Arc/MetJ family transcription regulator